jgi:hypothetical protein
VVLWNFFFNVLIFSTRRCMPSRAAILFKHFFSFIRASISSFLALPWLWMKLEALLSIATSSAMLQCFLLPDTVGYSVKLDFLKTALEPRLRGMVFVEPAADPVVVQGAVVMFAV